MLKWWNQDVDTTTPTNPLEETTLWMRSGLEVGFFLTQNVFYQYKPTFRHITAAQSWNWSSKRFTLVFHTRIVLLAKPALSGVSTKDDCAPCACAESLSAQGIRTIWLRKHRVHFHSLPHLQWGGRTLTSHMFFLNFFLRQSLVLSRHYYMGKVEKQVIILI